MSPYALMLICLCLGAMTLVPVFGQVPEEAADASLSISPSDKEVTVKELDTSEPVLWQMAAYAARSMSTKQRKFKLSTLRSAEQVDSTYRLRVTLQRVTPGYAIDPNDVLYCTVEINTDAQGQKWTVDNFGCTLPALVRRRRPQQKKRIEQVVESKGEVPVLPPTKYAQPIDNSIDGQSTDNDLSRNHVKRQARPYYYYPQAYTQPRYAVPLYPQYQAYYY